MAVRQRIPTRSCVACRTVRPKRELARVVRTADGRLVLDETGRLAGRGAYLCRTAECWTSALAKGTLQRALAAPLDADARAALEAGIARMTTTMMTTNEGEARGEE